MEAAINETDSFLSAEENASGSMDLKPMGSSTLDPVAFEKALFIHDEDANVLESIINRNLVKF